MLQQQKEISQIRRSAQYYRNKIHQHSHRASHSPSPSPSLILDEIQNASHLLDESELSVGDISVAEELSESEDHKSVTPTPLEDLEDSLPEEYSSEFPTYCSSLEQVHVHVQTASAKTEREKEEEERDKTLTESGLVSSRTPVKSKVKAETSPLAKKSPPGVKRSKSPKSVKSPTSESHTVKELERLAATDPHE